MNYMKPIPAEEIPIGPEWMYEIKYDGFRAMLTIQQGGTVTLITKTNTTLQKNSRKSSAAAANCLKCSARFFL